MTKPGFTVIPKSCLVTGGSGFVGRRLVEMLVERGCKRVVAFDITPAPRDAWQRQEIEYIKADLTNLSEVLEAAKGVEAVFHIAALVGPYHPKDSYVKVNYEGTLNVLIACKKLGIKKLVMSSSPSTRFPCPDPNVNNLTEDMLFAKNGGDYAPYFLQPYAETKALGEKAVLDAGGNREGQLLTIAVAPHQVYGPRDGLFLPSLLATAGSGKLRIFGNGLNTISFCHVDNYCHGLILGYEALYPGSPALSKFFVITDGPGVTFWKALDEAIVAMGFVSIWSKLKLPTWLMMFLAHLCVVLGNLFSLLSGVPPHRVNYALKLNPFAVKMLVIDRFFDISNARRELRYEPVVSFEQGWAQTIAWFQQHWLPDYLQSTGQQTAKAKAD
jgi:nucleoside-diphosphate-sugar epimerase